MAAVNTTRGVKLVLKVDDAKNGTFTTLCTINAARGITFNAQTNDDTVVDCDNPDAIAWLAREKSTLSVDFSGSGSSHKQDIYRLWTWLNAEESLPCKIIMDDDTPANVITFTGNFHLTSFDVSGDRGTKATSSLSVSSDGIVTATFGANVDVTPA